MLCQNYTSVDGWWCCTPLRALSASSVVFSPPREARQQEHEWLFTHVMQLLSSRPRVRGKAPCTRLLPTDAKPPAPPCTQPPFAACSLYHMASTGLLLQAVGWWATHVPCCHGANDSAWGKTHSSMGAASLLPPPHSFPWSFREITVSVASVIRTRGAQTCAPVTSVSAVCCHNSLSSTLVSAAQSLPSWLLTGNAHFGSVDADVCL